MPNIFLISDTHFGHTNAWKTFKLEDGVTPMRPFTSTEEMDETMISNWNSVVKPTDKIYHLGDIATCNATRLCSIFSRLNGEKVLIKGNHDEDKLSLYQELFKDVRGSHLLDNLVLTHIPVHRGSLDRWRGNIHGHLHNYFVRKIIGTDVRTGELKYSPDPDPKYECVSVERINYTPIPFETINKRFKDRGL
jgi:calcineurin-like phosphoesterase family protein